MSRPDPLEDLDLLLRSRYCIVVLDTPDEERAQSLLRHLADRRSLPLFTWTPTKGLRRDGKESGIYGTTEAGAALNHMESARFPAIYQFKGLRPYVTDNLVAERLKDAAVPFAEMDGALILTGSGIQLPDSVAAMSARLDLQRPLEIGLVAR